MFQCSIFYQVVTCLSGLSTNIQHGPSQYLPFRNIPLHYFPYNRGILEIRPLHSNFSIGFLLFFEKNQIKTVTFFMEECGVCDQILPDAWEQTQPWQCPGPGVSPHRHLDIVFMVKKITLTSLSSTILILE